MRCSLCLSTHDHSDTVKRDGGDGTAHGLNGWLSRDQGEGVDDDTIIYPTSKGWHNYSARAN
ncbi:MAG: hypothetical protein WC551_10670 [Patescibacteria group bacterium]